jgi:hypothetical protein
MQQASNCRADAVKPNMFIVSFKTVTFLNLIGGRGDLVAFLSPQRQAAFARFRNPHVYKGDTDVLCNDLS